MHQKQRHIRYPPKNYCQGSNRVLECDCRGHLDVRLSGCCTGIVLEHICMANNESRDAARFSRDSAPQIIGCFLLQINAQAEQPANPIQCSCPSSLWYSPFTFEGCAVALLVTCAGACESPGGLRDALATGPTPRELVAALHQVAQNQSWAA